MCHSMIISCLLHYEQEHSGYLVERQGQRHGGVEKGLISSIVTASLELQGVANLRLSESTRYSV